MSLSFPTIARHHVRLLRMVSDSTWSGLHLFCRTQHLTSCCNQVVGMYKLSTLLLLYVESMVPTSRRLQLDRDHICVDGTSTSCKYCSSLSGPTGDLNEYALGPVQDEVYRKCSCCLIFNSTSVDWWWSVLKFFCSSWGLVLLFGNNERNHEVIPADIMADHYQRS